MNTVHERNVKLIPNPAEEFLSIMPPEATSGSW